MGEREKGVATMPCPKCSTDLPLVTQADGSAAANTCGTCYPEAKPEVAAAKKPAREAGTDTKEH